MENQPAKMEELEFRKKIFSQNKFLSNYIFKREKRRDMVLSVLPLILITGLVYILVAYTIDSAVALFTIPGGIIISLIIMFIISKLFKIDSSGYNYIVDIYLEGYRDGHQDAKK